MTVQWWCQETHHSSLKPQDITSCPGTLHTPMIRLHETMFRSVRMGSKHNVRASILASSLSEVNLELHSSRASTSTGPPSFVLHSSRWVDTNNHTIGCHNWKFKQCYTSNTSKAKWWNFELLAESLVWYPKVRSFIDTNVADQISRLRPWSCNSCLFVWIVTSLTLYSLNAFFTNCFSVIDL